VLTADNPDQASIDGLPVLVLPAVEEHILFLFRHGQDGSGFGLDPPLLRPSADGFAGEFGDRGGVALKDSQCVELPKLQLPLGMLP
jgi:hypothetical protein